MADSIRYAKTEKGADEISNRRNNLRGKMRTMLILIDARKTADELREQAGKLGVPPDFLETMVHEGYIAPVGGMAVAPTAAPAAIAPTMVAATPGAAVPAAPAPSPPAASAEPASVEGTPISADEFARFREAKTFMNETVVNALGIRAFMFTLRLERCATRTDLQALFPDYEKAIRKAFGDTDAQVLTSHLRDLLA